MRSLAKSACRCSQKRLRNEAGQRGVASARTLLDELLNSSPHGPGSLCCWLRRRCVLVDLTTSHFRGRCGYGCVAARAERASTRSLMKSVYPRQPVTRRPNVLGVSCAAGPAWLRQSGAAVATEE